ncbi:MAG: alpha/beta hydrolase [Myxococcota bacterium]
MTAALGSILGWVACAPAFVQENERLARQFLEEHPDAARVILPSAERRRPLGYVASGNPEKPKVVFIHGSPGSWKAFARYLDDAELRSRAYLIAVDRPGYGESGAGDPERSVLRQAELIRQVFEIGDPRQPVILLGHSYGGPVAAQLAMTDDDRIRRLIVVAGSVDPTLEKTKWIQYPADWWLFRWLVPTDLDVCNQEILALKPELVRMLPDWSKIRASVHVIHGEQDDLVPVANAAFIESRTTHVATRTQRIADLNHFVPWLRYDLLHDAVIAALDALDALPDSPHSP